MSFPGESRSYDGGVSLQGQRSGAGRQTLRERVQGSNLLNPVWGADMQDNSRRFRGRCSLLHGRIIAEVLRVINGREQSS